MTAKRPSPLVGCNTGVEHAGRRFHVQTEDSGVDHPHVITHLFAEGGRIVVTRKTSYLAYVATPLFPAIARELIRAQHAEMIDGLRGGRYDDRVAAPASPRGPEQEAPFHVATLEREAAKPRTPAASAPPPPRAPVSPQHAPATAPKGERHRAISYFEIESSRDSLDDSILLHLASRLGDPE